MQKALYDDRGEIVRLERELKEGGEANVYTVEGRSTKCAKIYKSPNLTRFQKLSAMLQKPPRDPTLSQTGHMSIVWPERRLFRDRDRDPRSFAGFTMSLMDIRAFEIIDRYLTPSKRHDLLKHGFGRFNLRYLLAVAQNMSSAINAVNQCGCCVGDINESNILVASSSLVALIDTDSFQVPEASGTLHNCTAWSPRYLAPELQNYLVKEVHRTIQTDAFGLAILIFQLLMLGFHPFAGTPPAKAESPENISAGYFTYYGKFASMRQPAAPAFEILHPRLQDLFVKSFVFGHKNPKARPTAEEWYHTLKEVASDLETPRCKKNPKNHRYFSHLVACPWCETIRRVGRDPFPDLTGAQVALPALTVAGNPRTNTGPMFRANLYACPQCGRANLPDEIYCQRCAAQLCQNISCATCASMIPSRSTYCPQCSARI